MTAVTDYRPRHSWGDARLSTTHAQLAARLIVVDAAPHSTPLYRGRHRFENTTVSRLVQQERLFAQHRAQVT